MNDTDSSESTCEVPDAQKTLVRAVLFSQWGIPLDGFNKSYQELEGKPFPYRKLGFETLRRCLESIPDVVRFEYSEASSRWILYAVADDKSFMSSFTAKKQLSNSSAGLPKSRARNRRTATRNVGEHRAKRAIAPRGKGANAPREKAHSDEVEADGDEFPGLVRSYRGLFSIIIKCEEEDLNIEEIADLMKGTAPITEKNCHPRSRGNFLFFRYKKREQAVAVIQKFDRYLHKGKNLLVRPAEEKKPDGVKNSNANGLIPLHPGMMPPYHVASQHYPASPMTQPSAMFPSYTSPPVAASNQRVFTVEKFCWAQQRWEDMSANTNGPFPLHPDMMPQFHPMMVPPYHMAPLPHHMTSPMAQPFPMFPPPPVVLLASNQRGFTVEKPRRAQQRKREEFPSNRSRINGMKDERLNSRLPPPKGNSSSTKSTEAPAQSPSRDEGHTRNMDGMKDERVKTQPPPAEVVKTPPESKSLRGGPSGDRGDPGYTSNVDGRKNERVKKQLPPKVGRSSAKLPKPSPEGVSIDEDLKTDDGPLHKELSRKLQISGKSSPKRPYNKSPRRPSRRSPITKTTKPSAEPQAVADVPPPLLDEDDRDFSQENGAFLDSGPPPLLEDSDSESDWSDGEGPESYDLEARPPSLPNGTIEGATINLSQGRGRGLALFQSS